MKHLFSFDIFDTLITRRTATSKGIFALMQKYLFEVDEYRDYPARLRSNFRLLREEAERVARNTYQVNGIQDITLPIIYDCLRVIGQLSEEETEKLMQLEIRLERENILPIKKNIKKVKTLMEEGKRVVLISDMYLETKTIRNILSSFDDIFSTIPMYVSGDVGKTKWAHSLYYYVREIENIEFQNWYHYGDNCTSDVEIPQMLGINASLYYENKLQKWEQELIDKDAWNVDMQILLGVSALNAVNEEKDMSYRAGCTFAVQLLLPYVIWVLEESKRKKIEKLFFIARDGYILKHIADIVIEAYGYSIEAEYLYGSRRAWRMPAVTENSFDLKELFCWSNLSRIYSYEQVGDIMGLTLEELKMFLPCARENVKSLSDMQIQEVIRILALQQKEIASLICKKNSGKRHEAKEYLRQEIGRENKKIAFVELIGSGYSQRCLRELIKEFYHDTVETFFYRLDVCKEYDGVKNYVFFANRLSLGHMIEVLCGAPHGQTNGYKLVENRWEPVFGQDEGQLLEEYGFDSYLQGIKDYVKSYCSLYPDKPYIFKDLSVAKKYFDYWANGCDEELFQYFADMPYSITGREKKAVSFAPALTNKQIRKIFYTHKGEKVYRYFQGYDVNISLKRLSEKQKRRYAYYQKHSEDAWIKWLRRKYLVGEGGNSRYELLASDIVIYGAGKKGKLLYEQLTQKRRYIAKVLRRKEKEVPMVSCWVDKKYEEYQKDGLQVYAPKSILHRKFEQVVVAVSKKKMAEEIEKELIVLGIDSHKILWLNPNERLQ